MWGWTDTPTDILQRILWSASCVQNFDDSLRYAIRITYRISLRSSSLWEPRHPLLKVFWCYFDIIWYEIIYVKDWCLKTNHIFTHLNQSINQERKRILLRWIMFQNKFEIWNCKWWCVGIYKHSNIYSSPFKNWNFTGHTKLSLNVSQHITTDNLVR